VQPDLAPSPAAENRASDVHEPYGELLTRVVYKRATHVITDAVILTSSLFVSYFVRWDLRPPEFFVHQALALVPYVVASALLVGFLAGIYDVVWRYFGTRDIVVLASALTAHTMVLVAFRIFLPDSLSMLRIPLGVLAANLVISFLTMAGVRVARRLAWERAKRRSFSRGIGIKRVLVVGTGEVGVTLAKDIINRPELGMKMVGFVDDDLNKSAMIIHGLRVLGTSENLQRLVQRYNIDEVIITMRVPDSSVRFSAPRDLAV
jgi:FlaA1/EpsC-like NDP-sugar epimerase